MIHLDIDCRKKTESIVLSTASDSVDGEARVSHMITQSSKKSGLYDIPPNFLTRSAPSFDSVAYLDIVLRLT